ncbi:MAG TPA: long-chain fatty acid--CoA ligase [Longimicrobium sp.]|nr:long-chain fatty acid--CoA ligase [Longimicrobium sp.]
MPHAAPQPAHPPVPLRPVERDTIPRLFLGAVDRHDTPRAMLYKRDGAWHPLSHREVEQRVARLAAALTASGIGPGDRVAILAENRPEWAIADYAVTGIGAVAVPIYPTLPANQIEYILRDSSTRVVLASTRAQVAKIAEIRAALPELEQVVSFDPPGDAPGVQAFDEVLAGGQRALDEGRVPAFRTLAAAVGRDDVATLIYTSGTTGSPKGVMLTHHNLASNVAAVLQHGFDRHILPGYTVLSFLPLSHVFERMVDYLYWDVGACIAYAESIDQVADNLLEVSPQVAVSVPRLFDKIYAKVTGATGVRKKLVDWARRVGAAAADERLAGREPRGLLAVQFAVADRLVFSRLRQRTGGGLRFFVSGGAPLSAEVAKFFYAAGLPVYEGYGLTETSPVIAVNRPEGIRIGTVGQPVPGVEVAIAPGSGEILTRGPHVMKGYWNNPDATAQVVDAEGWFHTGDIGELTTDGYLRITDRLKNLLVTAGGKNIAPQPLENVVGMSPYVAQVVMIGDRRPYPSLLVVPDFENLRAWAATQGIAATDARALLEDARVAALLEAETLGRLSGFANYERPKKICLIEDEFTIDAGLLTPSLKIRRKQVEERYRDRIEALYASG